MPSPTSDSPRGSSRGKRAAERPPSRLRRRRGTSTPATPPAGDPGTDARADAAPAPAPVVPTPVPPASPPASPPATPAAGPTPLPATPAPATRTVEPEAFPDGPRRSLLVLWSAVLALGSLVLAGSALVGILDQEQVLDDPGWLPGWVAGIGSVAVVTSLSWLLATRTGGRALVSSGLALVLGAASLLVGGEVLPTGAAVLTCVVGSVYAVMVTVPAVTMLTAAREALVATLVATVTAFAAVGFEPTVSVERFEIVALLLALALVLAIVWRLGAGLHGLGRRGVVVVAIGLAVLFATLAYAELLRRYGAQSFVSSVLDLADATSEVAGAVPRPLVVLLGIPAIVWGTHVRARRRQGWWVCAFGVAATIPLAAGLVAPEATYAEAGLRALYSVVLGLLVGYLVIRADLALTGPKGRGGRRAEEAGPHRPEPRRFAEL